MKYVDLFTVWIVALVGFSISSVRSETSVRRHPDDPKDSLHEAAASGDIKNLLNILDERVQDVNARNQEGETPMHAACIYGHVTIIEALLAHGGDPNVRANAKTSLEMNPLTWCTYAGHVDAIRALIKGGADVNLVVRNAEYEHVTALDIALKFLGEDHAATNEIVEAGGLTWKGLVAEWETRERRTFSDGDWMHVPGVYVPEDSKMPVNEL